MKHYLYLAIGAFLMMCSSHAQLTATPYPAEIHIPALQTDHRIVDRAFRIAVGDLVGNVGRYKAGLLEQESLVILAGLD